MVNLALDLCHGSQDDGAGELIAVLRVDALSADPVGDIQLHFLKLVLSFQNRHLELTLVENLSDDLVA